MNAELKSESGAEDIENGVSIKNKDAVYSAFFICGKGRLP